MKTNRTSTTLRTATLLAGLALLLSIGTVSAAPVSLDSLLQEMVARDELARYPSPAFICRQFSSYDRDTVGADQPGWFANWDRSQFVRVEENDGRKEYVMLDAAGPGAVVRFWGTWHGPRKDGKLAPFSNGTMRVYLDNRSQPVIAGPIAELISGGKLIASPLSESVSPETNYERRGHNLFLPIPYAEHCKITYESDAITDFGGKNGEALYYQINYRTYDPEAKVVTFSMDQLEQSKPLVDRVGRQLVRSGVDENQTATTGRYEGVLAPGEQHTDTLEGPAAIRQLVLRLEADDLSQALRSTILQIAFDGQETVWCPVGDFAGIGYHVSPYRSWYTQVSEDGTLRCFWIMPFEKTCQLKLLNLGKQDVKLTASVETVPWQWDQRSMHFHATWRQYTDIDTGPDKKMDGKGAFDVNYVEVTGQGRYVGDTLTLFNGIDAWWGEGDEKIFIDGETFPSHVGTGTEDYYGYAWCRPERFESPFHAQPTGAGNLKGGFSVNSRYRLLDSLPFTKSIKFDMELWHWRATKMDYAPATFWYARPGAGCNVKPDPTTASRPVTK